MGDEMIKKYSNIKNIILPNKKVNILAILVLFLGVITGAIFSGIIGMNDRLLVIDKIKTFTDNINGNTIDSLLALKNSLSINLIYVFLIWILGMAFLGIIFNIFILFVKGFVFGFSIAAFILTYSYKGIVMSILYLLFGQLLNIIVILVLTIYSIMFSWQLLQMIFKDNNGIHIKRFLKNYLIILIFAVFVSIISSISEAFLLPALIKLIIKLFI